MRPELQNQIRGIKEETRAAMTTLNSTINSYKSIIARQQLMLTGIQAMIKLRKMQTTNEEELRFIAALEGMMGSNESN